MNKNIIKLFSRVEVVKTGVISPLVRPAYVYNLNTCVAAFGFGFDREVTRELLSGTDEDFHHFSVELLRALTDITERHSEYDDLLAGLPYDAPGEHKVLISRVVGFLRSHIGITKPLGLLPCGHVIDPEVIDLEASRACPICQYNLGGLRSAESTQVEYRADGTPLTLLNLADTDFLTDQANKLLEKPTPLSREEKDFLLSRLFQTDPRLTVPDDLHPETMPFAWACLSMRGGYLTEPKHIEEAAHLVLDAADVLRIAAFLSDPFCDLSLKESARFNLTPSRKETISYLIESLDISEKEIRPYSRHWKSLLQEIMP